RETLRKHWQRTRRRLGLHRFRWLGLENDSQLGYCSRELLSLALQRKAALYIAHSETAMWASVQLLKRGLRVGVDMEDWFSEDLLPSDRKNRPLKLLGAIERELLRNAAHATCTSEAMSSGLVEHYNCLPPTVIYNSFPWSDRQILDGQYKDRKDLR